jgi:urease accessory protein
VAPIPGCMSMVIIHMNTNPVYRSADALKLSRLLQLCSANLPVGGFAFSQGLEFAVEKQWLHDLPTTASWVKINLMESLAYNELPVMSRLYEALQQQDQQQFLIWNKHLIACRESAELRSGDLAMGKALLRLLNNLDDVEVPKYQLEEVSFAAAFVIVGFLWSLDLASLQSGFCWCYIDNQVAAATKLVPLGQTQSQNLLFRLSEEIENAITRANDLADDELGASLPRLAMASAWHESQYTRLFRS